MKSSFAYIRMLGDLTGEWKNMYTALYHPAYTSKMQFQLKD